MKNANENEQLCHPELDSGSLKETEILNINKSCKTEQSTFQNDNAKAAFTLAEVLITLGIIGIVAAMTLPTLVAKYKEKQRVTQVKKAYSILSQAYQMAVTEYGDINTWNFTQTYVETDDDGNNVLDTSGQKLVLDRLAKYMHTTSSKFEYENYISLSGIEVKSSTNAEKVTISLVDGVSLVMGWMAPKEPVIKGEVAIYLPERVVQEGVSHFYFYITPKGIVPAGGQNDTNRPFKQICDKSDKAGFGRAQGRGCAAWVVYNGNMDYLHCNDLDWNTKTKCK